MRLSNSSLLLRIKMTGKLPIFFRICHLFSHSSQKKNFFKIMDEAPKLPAEIIKPDQYPSNLRDTSPMITRGRPTRYITPRLETPQTKLMSEVEKVERQLYNDQWTSPQNAYALNIGLIGPVNAGKSQLLGKLAHKVSAISPKANTTSETITSIRSFQVPSDEGIRNVQLKYYDTPGIMYRKTGFISKGWAVLGEIDFSLLVIDSAKRFDDIIRESIKRLEKHRNYDIFMKALVLNKVDLVDNKRKFHSLIAEIEKYGKFDKIFYTSAVTGYGVAQLQDYLIKMAKKREWLHPKEAKTELTEVQIYQEMLREGLFHRLYKEVPYGLFIDCTSFAFRTNGVDELHFRVIVESENQQRMVIGKEGRNINWVIQHFKVRYAQIYKRECELYVYVNIKPNYRGKESADFEESYHDDQKRQKIKVVEDYFKETGKVFR